MNLSNNRDLTIWLNQQARKRRKTGSLSDQVRAILNKYNATMLLPGVGEPILGPELVVNGTGDSTEGWSQTYAGTTISEGGRFKLTNGVGGYGGLSRSVILVPGKEYQLSADYGHVDGTGFVTVSTTLNGTGQRFAPSPLLHGSQTYRNKFVATVANVFVTASQGGTAATGTVAYFDNISVREILGYNSTYFTFNAGNYRESTGQTLAAADQQVGLVVDAARVPVAMTAPSTGGTAGWAGYLCSISSSGGNLTATNTSASEGYVYFQQGNIIAGRAYEVQFEIVARTAASGSLQIGQTSMLASGLGFKTARAVATNTHGIWIGVGGTTIGNSMTIRNVVLRELPGIHASQSTSGFQPVLRNTSGIQSWQFDGIDDRLSLSAVPFQMADDHWGVVGASANTVTRHVVTFGGNTPVPYVEVGSILVGNGVVVARWRDDANTTVNINDAFTGGNVVASMRKIGNEKVLRTNGQASALNTQVMGVTTLSSAVSSIGGYGGSDLHNGHIHGVIFGKGAITDRELLTLERFMATLQGRAI